MKSETEIQREIIDFLEASGHIVFRMNSGKVRKGSRYIRLSDKGTPDLLAVGYYGNLWIEVKKPGENPDKDQLEMHERLRSRGETVIVARSVNDLTKALYV